MADPISCEGWDTGKPFLGVPSKFVVINEDGEEIGTLDKLIPLLMLVSNNLSDIEDTVEARNNLGVYSKEEVDSSIETATPQATSTVKGQAKIATTAIAQAGTNDTDIITAKKLRDALNASGDAPMFPCRAWIYFDGTTTPPAIKASGNISSITDLGAGRYKINFLTQMPHANFVALSLVNRDGGSASASPGLYSQEDQTVSSVTVQTNHGTNYVDLPRIGVAIIC